MRSYMMQKIAPKTEPFFLINGDSLSRDDQWPAYLFPAYPNVDFVNTSVAGKTLFGYGVPLLPRDGWSNYSSARSVDVFNFSFGSNDIVNGQTAAQIWLNYTNSVAAVRPRNPNRFIVTTTIGWRIGLSATEEAERQSYNSQVRANPSQYDFLVDRDLLITASDYPTLIPDGTHPNAAGNFFIAYGRSGVPGYIDACIAAGLGYPQP